MDDNLPDEQVVVKQSICQVCNGVVRQAIKHCMDAKSKRDFAAEALEYNLKITEIPLLEYRENKSVWCSCK